MWLAVCFVAGLFLQAVISVSVTDIQIVSNEVTIKGSQIKVHCATSNFSNGNVVYIARTDIDKENPETQDSLTICFIDGCFAYDGYTFSPNAQGITITIKSLNRNADQKWWHCYSEGSSKKLYITVYTPPSSLMYTSKPAQSQDLSSGAVTLTCTTSCTYPQPVLKWLFIDGRGSSEYSPGTVSSSSNCQVQEKTFSYSLTLPRYTTFTNNEDKTVKFKCGIPAVPAEGLLSPLYSPESPDITFAVQVTSVSLTDCTSAPGTTITVTEGVASQLCCNPRTSRPPAVIVWYIENTERKRSTETTFRFSPTNTDHNKNINCKAFNIPPETNGVTSKVHTLYVNVPVTSVTLKDGNSKAGSKLTVTQGVSKTLTCDPGTSRPAPFIAWYKGGSLQDSSSTTYTFTPNNGDNSNVIYCAAVNSGSKVVESGKSTLYVRVEAGTPDLKNKPSDALLSGDDVSFICQTTPTRPAASVTWKKGGVQMNRVSSSETTSQDGRTTITSTATFNPEQADHQKYIVCETAIPDQSSATDDRTQVTVLWPPSAPTVTPSTQFPWREGQTDKYLLCGATNMGNPSSSETWTSLSGSKQPDRRLQYASLTSSLDGEAATCKLENAYTQKKNIEFVSQEVHLDVQYKPIVTVSVNNIERENIKVNEGQSLLAMCTARGNPSPTVEWLGQTTNPASTLSFQDIDRTDDQTFTCRARATSAQYPDYGFTTEKMLNIGVNYAPAVTVTSSNELGRLRLSCNAVGKPRMYTYRGFIHSWRGQQIQDLRQLNRQVFDIPSPQLEDSGNYTCYVDNDIVDREGQLIQHSSHELLVEGQPVVLSKENMFVGKLSESSNVIVQFYSHPAHQNVKIKRDDVTLSNTNTITVVELAAEIPAVFHGKTVFIVGTSVTLKIKNLTETDFSNYTFEVTNNQGIVIWPFSIVSQRNDPSDPSPYIAGGVVGGLAVVFIAAIIIVFFVRRKLSKPKGKSSKAEKGKNSTNSQKNVAVVYENTVIDLSVEYRPGEPVVVGGGTSTTDSKDIVVPQNNDSRNSDAYETLTYDLEHQRQYESLQNTSEKDIPIVMEPPKVTESAILLRDLEEVVFSPDSAAERFSGEFQNFRNGMTKEHNAALHNRSRNKYRKLYAYDDTRVVLDIWDDDSDTDYINACYIQGFKKTNAYIASQGLIKNNLNDFWRMVWQTNAAQIVMLTNIIEHGKDKCIKYWPEDGNEMYGRITVTLAARETFSSFVIRTFMVNKDFEPPRQVKQFQFTGWPDKDVPAFCSSLVHFRSKVNAAASSWDVPVVVHCSAGIGRTGTYIAIDYLVDEAEELGYVDVVGCVTALREQRVNMVQKEKQYVFVHLSLVEILLLQTSVVSISGFVDSYKHLLKPVNGIRQIDADFQLLWKLSPKVEEIIHNSDESLVEQNVIKDDEYMPSYSEPGLMRNGEFIDAAFLPLYRDDNAMIIATTPTEWTIEKFWNLVYHQQVHSIVMMNQEGVYWPGENRTFTHGDITVRNNGAEKKGSHCIVKLTMHTNGSERDIQLLLFGTWEDDESVPDDPNHVLSALDIVGSSQKKTGNHPVVVHCMDGITRSGLFCVIAALLDRTKIEQDVAISQVIQEMRDRRKNVIPNVEQFEFCHDVVCTFLQQFDSYSNFTFGE